jgi:hypothetical protein
MTRITNNHFGRVIATVASTVVFDSNLASADSRGGPNMEFDVRAGAEFDVIMGAEGVVCIVAKSGHIVWKHPAWESSESESLTDDGTEGMLGEETETETESDTELETETE